MDSASSASKYRINSKNLNHKSLIPSFALVHDGRSLPSGGKKGAGNPYYLWLPGTLDFQSLVTLLQCKLVLRSRGAVIGPQLCHFRCLLQHTENHPQCADPVLYRYLLDREPFRVHRDVALLSLDPLFRHRIPTTRLSRRSSQTGCLCPYRTAVKRTGKVAQLLS